ncbi:hypothetical protein RFI_21947 [Reticulomyxa filosa]|uniref:Uncharacterized protein n=1 Tax=Reticulomyxa filosa TaxID=46433 RepID=X6MPT4_RETFI|nr:hypothetical protein RFI_21947 [Reticulomyxa filosa]|eukprot:ETO15417.1 hypothetical protein RFI_21947 [Reticulomyxa filosa]
MKLNNQIEEKEVKQASNKTLTKINDIKSKKLQIVINHILKFGINQAKNDIKSKLIKFVYDQLCELNSKEKLFMQILFEYFKKYVKYIQQLSINCKLLNEEL